MHTTLPCLLVFAYFRCQELSWSSQQTRKCTYRDQSRLSQLLRSFLNKVYAFSASSIFPQESVYSLKSNIVNMQSSHLSSLIALFALATVTLSSPILDARAFSEPNTTLPNGAVNPFYPCGTDPSTCPYRCYVLPDAGANMTKNDLAILQPQCFSKAEATDWVDLSKYPKRFGHACVSTGSKPWFMNTSHFTVHPGQMRAAQSSRGAEIRRRTFELPARRHISPLHRFLRPQRLDGIRHGAPLTTISPSRPPSALRYPGQSSHRLRLELRCRTSALQPLRQPEHHWHVPALREVRPAMLQPGHRGGSGITCPRPESQQCR